MVTLIAICQSDFMCQIYLYPISPSSSGVASAEAAEDPPGATAELWVVCRTVMAVNTVLGWAGWPFRPRPPIASNSNLGEIDARPWYHSPCPSIHTLLS